MPWHLAWYWWLLIGVVIYLWIGLLAGVISFFDQIDRGIISWKGLPRCLLESTICTVPILFFACIERIMETWDALSGALKELKDDP